MLTIAPIGNTGGTVHRRASAPATTKLPALGGQQGRGKSKGEEVLAATRERRQSLDETQRSLAATLARCEKVRTDSADLGQRWDNMKEQFQAVLSKCIDDFAAAGGIGDHGMSGTSGGGGAAALAPDTAAATAAPAAVWTCGRCGVRGNRSLRACMACNRPPPARALHRLCALAQPAQPAQPTMQKLRCRSVVLEQVNGTLDGVADLIRRGGNVTFLTGAGVSTASGIPDFRSVGGMYDTLRPELLTASEAERAAMASDPTAVVGWALFEHNPLPYLELRRPFILGVHERRWRPTLAHFFMRVTHDHGKLGRVFTQNIDGLDFAAGLPPEKLVPVHGSMAQVACEHCGAEQDAEVFQRHVATQVRDIYADDAAGAVTTSVAPRCSRCGAAGVKPATVLYGRRLPEAFSAATTRAHMRAVDVLLVMGTSLTVGPANRLPGLVQQAGGGKAARVLVNREVVGREVGLSFCGGSSGDVYLGGAHAGCDEVCLELAARLEWLPQLAAFRDDMAPSSQRLLDAALAERGSKRGSRAMRAA